MSEYKNHIQRTEALIKSGAIREQVLRFHVYELTGSPKHIMAGSDWRLCMSADTQQDAEEMIKEHGYEHDFYIIIDGEDE